MKIAIFGLGYVGTVTAAGLTARGHTVVGVDVDAGKIQAIRDGRSPIVEPGVEALIARGVADGLLRATDDPVDAIEQADVSLVCVATPSVARSGCTDLTYISRAVGDIRTAMESARPPEGGIHAVAIRSTVPPGTGRDIVAPVFAGQLPGGWRVGTAMCPEFLREGCAMTDFGDPPFVVVGASDEPTRDVLAQLFSFIGKEIHQVSVETAEALKYACNAFHATKVTFANEIAQVFRPLGVDSREVMRIFCEDVKLNLSATYLRPGFAFGGSCLPKDLRSLQYMARMSGIDAPLLLGTSASNDVLVRGVVDRILGVAGRQVAILGLSFKSDTDDLRESPYVELAERLIGKGFGVRIYDPILNPDRLVGTNRAHVEARLPHLSKLLTSTPQEALSNADVAIVSSADPCIHDALLQSSPKMLLDLHGNLGSDVEAVASYEGVGW